MWYDKSKLNVEVFVCVLSLPAPWTAISKTPAAIKVIYLTGAEVKKLKVAAVITT